MTNRLTPKTAFVTSQLAHITCKKDHHEILAGSVSKDISAAYEKLLSSSLVFIKAPNKDKVRSVYLSKHAKEITIDSGSLTYTLSNGDGGFSMKHSIEDNLPRGSAILFVIQSFDLFVTGDLSYYADVLGMPASTSYWCPFCLLSRPEWQQSAENIGAERTVEFQTTTYTAILSDIEKKMTPADKKGVSTEMHYQCLTPQNFVPPLLHLEIGMVNQMWDNLVEWIDEEVEIIPLEEKEARTKLKSALEERDNAKAEKKDSEKTVEIEIREKNGEIKALKAALRRKDISSDEKQQVNMRLTLLQTFISEQKKTPKNFEGQPKIDRR